MTKKSIASIRTGKGIEFPVGTEFTLTYDPDKISTSIYCVDNQGRRVIISCDRMYKYFPGFKKAPSLATIERYMENASATTITGKSRVECDGVGSDSFPAWPLALGMI